MMYRDWSIAEIYISNMSSISCAHVPTHKKPNRERDQKQPKLCVFTGDVMESVLINSTITFYHDGL